MQNINKQLQERIYKLTGKRRISHIKCLRCDDDMFSSEPSLQDLLLALNNIKDKDTSYCIYSNGALERTIFDCGVSHFYSIIIDLSLSLFNQTTEVKQKLLELLNSK